MAWFRGTRSHRHRLVPSLYRLGDASWSSDAYLDLEERLLDRFQERSLPYRSGSAPSEKLSYLFEMQHYGAPTRLLDWSENVFMALWFAIEDPAPRRARVWVLDANLWNDLALHTRKDVTAVLAPTHDGVGQGLLPWVALKRTSLLDHPLCIFGMHNSTRIVGPRGVFTLSGLSRAPMEEQARQVAALGARQSSEFLMAIDIPADKKAIMRKDMSTLGFSRSMIFPDLVGLAQELAERAREGTL